MSWAGETKALLSTDELGKDVASAEEMSDRHQELKIEIENNEEKSAIDNVFRKMSTGGTFCGFHSFVNLFLQIKALLISNISLQNGTS